MGYQTLANGTYTTSIGVYTHAEAYASLVIGRYNLVAGSTTTWQASDPLFVIGNGSSNALRSNAVTVLKNGCVGLQAVTNPTYALQLPNDASVSAGSGRAYAWTTYSDSRLKEDQIPIAYGLKELMELSPMQYIHHSSIDQSTWAKENIPRTIGLIAQEVYKIIPEAVDVPENSTTGLWGLNYDKLIPVLVKGIQEQQQQISSQQLQIESTKQENQQLRSEIDELKSLVNTLAANQTAQVNK
jgi:Chaperone of endosialidase